MKTAKQWQEELAGETSVQSIQRIQVDALVSAASIVVQARRAGLNPISELVTFTAPLDR